MRSQLPSALYREASCPRLVTVLSWIAAASAWAGYAKPLSTEKSPAEPKITFRPAAPLDYQVFQRRSGLQGRFFGSW